MTQSQEPTLYQKRVSKTPDVAELAARVTQHASSALIIPSQFVTHSPKAGLNPLADTSAYLFSIIGKLKPLKTYRHLNKLHEELVQEINHFQDAAKTLGYSSDYILASRFSLCATLDDIIMNTAWGGQGHWEPFSLLKIFHQDAPDPERFFLILDRISKDPAHYIDVMELMYICLSLGFKGPYRTTEFGNHQLEQITHALYKKIRSFRGDFSKTLSPFPIKAHAPSAKPSTKKISLLATTLTTASIIMAIFIGLSYLLDTLSNQTYQELMHIGKSTPYETIDS